MLVVQYRRVTDGRTQDDIIYRASNASRGKNRKNGHISAAALPMGMNYGRVTYRLLYLRTNHIISLKFHISRNSLQRTAE